MLSRERISRISISINIELRLFLFIGERRNSHEYRFYGCRDFLLLRKICINGIMDVFKNTANLN